MVDFRDYNNLEVIKIYSDAIKELRNRGVLRTNNVIGELGEYFVLESYLKNPNLPTLSAVPVGTQNISAISQDGKRYCIKSTSGNVTGVFRGLQPPQSKEDDVPLFEYVVICKFDEDYSVEAIIEIDWDTFEKYKKWHTRMQAWNLTITSNLKKDATIIYAADDSSESNEKLNQCDNVIEDKEIVTATDVNVIWNKAGVDHKKVRECVVAAIGLRIGTKLEKLTTAQFVSTDKEVAVLVSSSKFSEKNKEYWYSIDYDIIRWFEDFPRGYVGFALGSEKKVLLLGFEKIRDMLPGCLSTAGDIEKKKKAHYHFSFAVNDDGTVWFKKKKPENKLVEVTEFLM